MTVPHGSIVALGQLTPWGKGFLDVLEKENVVDLFFEGDVEKFLGSQPAGNRLILAIENIPESRDWIRKIREAGLRVYVLWFGRGFTKEDMAFAMRYRVYSVWDSLNPLDEEVSTAISRVANLVEDDRRFGALVHSIKQALVQLQGDVPHSLLTELKSAVEKVAEYGVLNELGVGASANTKKGDAKLILPEADQLSDALTTVDTLERTGILWIKGKERGEEGQIDFIQGKIVNSKTGEVSGLKAVYRMFLWEVPSFLFTYREPQDFVVLEDLNLSVKTICLEGENLRHRYFTMRRELPPGNLELELDTKHFNSDVVLPQEDFYALASVVEFGRVSNIVDYTDIPDVNLYESLIRLRKNRLIRVAT